MHDVDRDNGGMHNAFVEIMVHDCTQHAFSIVIVNDVEIPTIDYLQKIDLKPLNIYLGHVYEDFAIGFFNVGYILVLILDTFSGLSLLSFSLNLLVDISSIQWRYGTERVGEKESNR